MSRVTTQAWRRARRSRRAARHMAGPAHRAAPRDRRCRAARGPAPTHDPDGVGAAPAPPPPPVFRPTAPPVFRDDVAVTTQARRRAPQITPGRAHTAGPAHHAPRATGLCRAARAAAPTHDPDGAGAAALRRPCPAPRRPCSATMPRVTTPASRRAPIYAGPRGTWRAPHITPARATGRCRAARGRRLP